MRIYISIMFLWVSFCSISAQDKSQPELKNAISIELDYALFVADVAINYERTVRSSNNNKKLTNLRFGFAKYTMGHLGGTEKGLGFKLSLNPIIGNGKSYFESDFGLGVGNITFCQMNFGCPEEWRIWPIINIGYRYQYKIIFRCYLGTLGIGIGLGLSF